MGILITTIYVALSHLSPGDLFPDIGPYRPLLVLAILGTLVAIFDVARFSYPSRPTENLLVFLFVLVVLISPIAHGWFGGSLVAFSAFMPSAMAFFICAATLRKIRHFRILTASLIVTAIYLSVCGLAAYYYGYSTDLFIYQWPPPEEVTSPDQAVIRRVRAIGFMKDPNDFAQFILIVLPFLWLAWKKRSLLRNLSVVAAPTLVMTFTLLRTQSRGGLLGLAAVTGFALRKRMGNTMSMIAAGLLLVGIFASGFASDRSMSVHEDSASGRVEAWSTGIAMWKSNPLLGVGYGKFTDNNEEQGLTAHNSFVLCLAELGTIGYFLWLAALTAAFLDVQLIIKTLQRPPDTDETLDEERERRRVDIVRWAQALRLALLAFVVTAWFLSRTYVMTLYVLLGMVVAINGIARRETGKDLRAKPRRVLSFATYTAMVSVACVYSFIRARWM